LRACAAALAGWLLSGCAGSGLVLPPHCPVELVSSEALPPGLLLRAKLRFSIDDESVALEAVAESSQQGLALVGIAPYGASLFALRQRGQDVSLESAASRKHRYLAYFTLDALHRIYWIEPPGGQGLAAPERWSWGAEVVSHRAAQDAAGGARRRVFARGHEAVAIEYPGAAGGGIHIENPWCGYRAVVVTLDAGPDGEPLDADARSESPIEY
jgi:hypothetical protein